MMQVHVGKQHGEKFRGVRVPADGGLFFGWLGDRHGRRTALLVTVIGMGFATACIGLLPGYGTIGVLAPSLLLAFRMAQGLFAGGEVTGAAT